MPRRVQANSDFIDGPHCGWSEYRSAIESTSSVGCASCSRLPLSVTNVISPPTRDVEAISFRKRPAPYHHPLRGNLVGSPMVTCSQWRISSRMTEANASRLSAEISKHRVPGLASDGVTVTIVPDFIAHTLTLTDSMAAGHPTVPDGWGVFNRGRRRSAIAPISGTPRPVDNIKVRIVTTAMCQHETSAHRHLASSFKRCPIMQNGLGDAGRSSMVSAVLAALLNVRLRTIRRPAAAYRCGAGSYAPKPRAPPSSPWSPAGMGRLDRHGRSPRPRAA